MRKFISKLITFTLLLFVKTKIKDNTTDNHLCEKDKCGRFDKIIKRLFKKRHDTRILKTMDEYRITFELDDKIAQNRHRLREQYEQYKKIENYYPLFLAYIGAIGIYYFDFITIFGNTNPIFTLIGVVLGLVVLCSCYMMGKIFFTKKWKNDYLPIDVYQDFYNNTKLVYPGEEESVLIQKTKEAYLLELEKYNEANFNVYNDKKKKIPCLMYVIIISLFLYSINIGMYKYIKMADDKKKVEQPIVVTPPPSRETNEGVKPTPTTDKQILTGQDRQTKNVLSFDEFISEKKNLDSLRNFVKKTVREELKKK